ncbi:MFS transporter [Cohnella rhizosphaerae]|uniref:MFS transporter n=1 Tax=Cohnella rhizosphaerae TaxID=1457232 RepID=A0A9X4L0T4_9BACL|nr:MFS transporter [Cohnella rhizosphaerae]MDG0814051.1 MFS transporter [Cohnella rhizosphaerae]
MDVRSRKLLIAVGLGVLLNPLNSSMIAVAIARLQQVYELDYTEVSWIIFSFYLASAIAQPVMGKVSDLFGRRKIFLAGLVVSFFSSMLAPLSPGFGWLIASRVAQSIGTSMLVAVGMAIVRIHVTEKQASALSVLSVFLSGAAAIGPFAGGRLAGAMGLARDLYRQCAVRGGELPAGTPRDSGGRSGGRRQAVSSKMGGEDRCDRDPAFCGGIARFAHRLAVYQDGRARPDAEHRRRGGSAWCR